MTCQSCQIADVPLDGAARLLVTTTVPPNIFCIPARRNKNSMSVRLGTNWAGGGARLRMIVFAHEEMLAIALPDSRGAKRA